MYAVIFRAEIDQLDQEYSALAKKLRSLAMEQYGCLDFISLSEGNCEIAISYWSNRQQIEAWKQDDIHLAAQRLGREKWYKSYQVQIVKIEAAYEKTIQSEETHG